MIWYHTRSVSPTLVLQSIMLDAGVGAADASAAVGAGAGTGAGAGAGSGDGGDVMASGSAVSGVPGDGSATGRGTGRPAPRGAIPRGGLQDVVEVVGSRMKRRFSQMKLDDEEDTEAVLAMLHRDLSDVREGGRRVLNGLVAATTQPHHPHSSLHCAYYCSVPCPHVRRQCVLLLWLLLLLAGMDGQRHLGEGCVCWEVQVWSLYPLCTPCTVALTRDGREAQPLATDAWSPVLPACYPWTGGHGGVLAKRDV